MLLRRKLLVLVLTLFSISGIYILHTFHETVVNQSSQLDKLNNEMEILLDSRTRKEKEIEGLRLRLDHDKATIAAQKAALVVIPGLKQEIEQDKQKIVAQAEELSRMEFYRAELKKDDRKIMDQQKVISQLKEQLTGEKAEFYEPHPPGVEHWDELERTKTLLQSNGYDYNDLVSRGLMGGEASDDKSQKRRMHVKNMMKHAWNSYVQDAWGYNELRPLTRQGKTNGGIFGSGRVGATLIDTMDTLFLMEEYEEVMRCRAWIKRHFKANFLKTGHVSVFEVTIRFIGGFNSMYAFTNDPLYKEMSQFVADQLLAAFTKSSSPLNYPYINIGLQTPGGGVVPLAIVGTTQLEWAYLSKITGNLTYHNYSTNAMAEILNTHYDIPGLYPRKFDVRTGAGITSYNMGIGGENDSFYEYILKYWLFTGRGDDRLLNKWRETQQAIIYNLAKTSRRGLTYLPDISYERHLSTNLMEHLTCFVGGLLALSSTEVEADREVALQTGAEVSETCHMAYEATMSKLGAEDYYIMEAPDPADNYTDPDAEATAAKGPLSDFVFNANTMSLQRPEAVESWFYMWRITKDPKYREWGWDYVQAIEKNYRVEHGYASLKDVTLLGSYHNNLHDEMQSFFLAETLKYLYLLYSDDSLVPLDKYVFNTEAHPLPILNHGDLPDMPLRDVVKKPPPTTAPPA